VGRPEVIGWCRRRSSIPKSVLLGSMRKQGEAVIELSVKIVNDRSGRILAGQVFTSRVPSVVRSVGRWPCGAGSCNARIAARCRALGVRRI